MPLVVDSSTAVAWLLPDEHHPAARRALAIGYSDGFCGPRLLWYEIRNALIISERRGRLLAGEIERGLAALADLQPEFIDDHDERQVLDLSRKHKLSVYDAAYLELALRLGTPLATLDGRLAAAATAEGVEVVG